MGSSAQVNPARIERVRTELPSGYEVAGLSGRAAPVAFWGLRPDWIADPQRCGALADPVAGGAATRGWSASGAGGIVYAMVAASGAALDPSRVQLTRRTRTRRRRRRRWRLSARGGQDHGHCEQGKQPHAR